MKKDEPDWFAAWKKGGSADWRPTYTALKTPEKTRIKEELIEEQGHVCCYCGRRIDADDSHIEHFRPQNQNAYAHLSVDYGNLHASCIKETLPGLPLHCGHVKGNTFDENRCISPLEEGVEKLFSYSLDGSITPSSQEDERARYMIRLLDLDNKSLCNRRKDVFSTVFSPDIIDTVTREELLKMREAYGKKDSRGLMPAFGHAIARISEDWGASFA